MELGAMEQLLLAALAAATGSFILWKYYGSRVVKDMIIKHAAEAFWAKIEDLLEHPESKDSERFGRLIGLGMIYVCDALGELVSTKEGRERLQPAWESLYASIQGAIFGAYGNIMKNLQKQGQSSPIAIGDMALPPEITGIASKMFPGVDINQAMGLIKFLGNFQGLSQLSPGEPENGGRGPGGQI